MSLSPSCSGCWLGVAAFVAWRLASARAGHGSQRGARLHSRPGYYGTYLAIWTAAPGAHRARSVGLRPSRPSSATSSARRCRRACGTVRRPSSRLIIGRIAPVAKGLPTLSREDYEVIKRVRVRLCRSPTTRCASCRTAASRSARRLSPTSSPLPTTRWTYETAGSRLHHRCRRRARAARLAIRPARASARSCAPATWSSRSCCLRPPARLDGRHPDHRRHRPVDAVRDHPLLPDGVAARLLLRHRVGSALLGRGRRRRRARASSA